MCMSLYALTTKKCTTQMSRVQNCNSVCKMNNNLESCFKKVKDFKLKSINYDLIHGEYSTPDYF